MNSAAPTQNGGETVGNLRFFLAPDSPPPTMPQDITVLGFDGNPASHAQIVAYDDMWENPVAPAMADADEYGKAITLRPGQPYLLSGVRANHSQ